MHRTSSISYTYAKLTKFEFSDGDRATARILPAWDNTTEKARGIHLDILHRVKNLTVNIEISSHQSDSDECKIAGVVPVY
jgi:hypothetical protein